MSATSALSAPTARRLDVRDDAGPLRRQPPRWIDERVGLLLRIESEALDNAGLCAPLIEAQGYAAVGGDITRRTRREEERESRMHAPTHERNPGA